MNQIREQTSNSSIKQEALSLIDQLSELELIHDQLFIPSTDDEQIDEFLTLEGLRIIWDRNHPEAPDRSATAKKKPGRTGG